MRGSQAAITKSHVIAGKVRDTTHSKKGRVVSLEEKIRNILGDESANPAPPAPASNAADPSGSPTTTDMPSGIVLAPNPKGNTPAGMLPELDVVHPTKLSWSKLDVWVKPSLTAPKRMRVDKEYIATDMRHIIHSGSSP
jgi:hypothetical protein